MSVKILKTHQTIENAEFSSKPILPFEILISFKEKYLKLQLTDIDNLEYKATLDLYTGNEYYSLCYKRKIFKLYYNKNKRKLEFKKEQQYIPFGVY